MTEALLNKLLRRVDWRFLLPTPVPEKSVCFGGGLLADAVRLVSARTVQPRARDVMDCDLAVIVNPGHESIEQAWKHLRPGGSIYVEFCPYLPLRAATISRHLERTGFENISCYRPWPSAEAAQLWVPSNSSSVRRYLRASRTTGATFFRRARDLAAYFKWVAHLRFARKLPVCLIAHKPPSAPGLRLEEMLGRALPCAGLGRPQSYASQLLMTGGRRSINKVVSLIFAEPRPQPILAAKMARVSDSALGLEKEASRLNAVRSLSNGRVEGVPRLLFKAAIGGTFTIGETAFTGIPMFARLNRRNYRPFATKATDWLIGLAGEPRSLPRHQWWGRLVQPIFAKFERSYACVTDHRAIKKAEQTIYGLPALPLVCEHRDFSPWNILLTPNGGLAVLDWESAEPEGLPGLDLIYFLTYLAFSLDGAADEVSYRRSYRIGVDKRSFTGSINAECLQRYASALGLPMSYFRPLRLLTWMLHSRSEHEHLVADADGEPTSEALGHSLFFNLWNEELRMPP